MAVSRRCPQWKISTSKILSRNLRSSPIVLLRNYSSTASPSNKRLWFRLTVVTLTAAGIGAYVKSRQENLDGHLNPLSFAQYRLVSREQVSSTNSIFTLEPAVPADNRETYELAWQTGLWSVMFKQPQLQIGRDYTPLPPPPLLTSNDESSKESSDGINGDSLRFLIRRDPHGEVSRYLHSLQQGAKIELRGPQVECEIPPEVKNVLFIAGGTGIAPALQAIHIIFRRSLEGKKPRIHILWANRKREDCAGGISDTPDTVHQKSSRWWSPFQNKKASTVTESEFSLTPISEGAIVRELQQLKTQYPGQITVDYFVDEENSFISTKNINSYIDSVQPSTDTKRMVIISGPEGFVNYMAGPKIWAHGYELQGPVKGIIQPLGLKDWEIWKL